MTKEEAILQEYEKKLNELYARANTKSKKKRLLTDLINFSRLCYEHFGIDKTFEWEKDPEIISLIDNLTIPFIEGTYEQKDMFLDISSSVLNTFLDIRYNLYSDYGKNMSILSSYEIQELTFTFLSKYNPELLKTYKEKLEDFEMFDVSMIGTTGFAGITYPMPCLKKNIIFCDNNFSNILTASTLMHELGHSYEYDLKRKCGYKDFAQQMGASPYLEVSSKFLEYTFLNFLKENKIIDRDIHMAFTHYYQKMLENIYGIHIICRTPYLHINGYGYAEINDATIASYANTIKDGLNYHDVSSDIGEQINYRNSFIYGLGSLLSIYLYENYKQDHNMFQKEFKNALINYPYIGIEAFERVGVTPEILIEGKTLKKVLTDIEV